MLSLSARGAWIEIGMEIDGVSYDVWSLSARGAWIEMWVLRKVPLLGIVALRKGSVDRNLYYQDNMRTPPRSLSARGAWIEISCD